MYPLSRWLSAANFKTSVCSLGLRPTAQNPFLNPIFVFAPLVPSEATEQSNETDRDSDKWEEASSWHIRSQALPRYAVPRIGEFRIVVNKHTGLGKLAHNYFFASNEKRYVARCGIFRIFLSLRVYVKSILNNVEVWKLHFFSISKAVNFVYSAFKKCKISWKSKFRYFKCVKIAGFEPPDLLLWFHVKSEWYVENL